MKIVTAAAMFRRLGDRAPEFVLNPCLGVDVYYEERGYSGLPTVWVNPKVGYELMAQGFAVSVVKSRGPEGLQ